MKKTLMALMLCLVSVTFAFAEKKVMYCELVGTSNIFKGTVSVTADFGETNAYHHQALVDERGKAIQFNSMVDAMNYMGAQGWELAQAYVVSTQNGGVYHWLLKKEVEEQPQEQVAPAQ